MISLVQSLKLLDHTLPVGSVVSDRVLYVIYIISVTTTISLHNLQEDCKFFEIWRTFNAQHMAHLDGACGQIAYHNLEYM